MTSSRQPPGFDQIDLQFPRDLQLIDQVQDEASGEFLVRVRYEGTIAQECPHCGRATVSNGSRKARYRDIPQAGRPVVIEWIRQRRLCRSCGKSSLERSDFFDIHRHMTVRLLDWLVQEGTSSSFTSVAERAGVDVSTVTSVFGIEAPKLTPRSLPQEVAVLGLERLMLVGRDRPVLYDSRGKQLIDIASDSDELTLGIIYSDTPKPRCERLVVSIQLGIPNVGGLIDFDVEVVGRQSLLDYANSLVVVHVRRLLETTNSPSADKRIWFRDPETLKRTARRRLDTWSRDYKPVAEAYSLHAEFVKIWSLRRRDADRRKLFDLWRDRVCGSERGLRDIFLPVCVAVESEYEKVFAFYDDPNWRDDESGAQWVRNAIRAVKRTHSFSAVTKALLSSKDGRMTQRERVRTFSRGEVG